MNRIISLIFVSLLLAQSAKAALNKKHPSPRSQIELKNLVIKNDGNVKSLSRKLSNRLIGNWQLTFGTDLTGNTIQIKSISRGKGVLKRTTQFSYNVYTSDGGIKDRDLIGFIQGRTIYFSVSFLDGYSLLVGTLSKNFNNANLVDLFINDRVCSETDFFASR